MKHKMDVSNSEGAPVSALCEEIAQLRKVWRRDSVDTATILKSVLAQLNPETKLEARLLGETLRYRAEDDEWAMVVQEYLGSQSRKRSLILGLVLGFGYAPLIKNLVSGSVEDFVQFVGNFPLSEVNSLINAVAIFVMNGGLQDLSREQRRKARELFVRLIEKWRGLPIRIDARHIHGCHVPPDSCEPRPKLKGRYRIGHKPFYPDTYKKMAILGLEQIGTRDDFRRLVPHIGKLGSKWGSYVIRLVLPSRPKGLRPKLEEVLRTKDGTLILATALVSLMDLTGSKAEAVVRDFLQLDHERYRRIVALALKQKYPVEYLGEEWARRLAEIEGSGR